MNSDITNLLILSKRKSELKPQAEKLREKCDEEKWVEWVACVKKMENLQKFVIKSNFFQKLSKEGEFKNNAD
jgi:hypothetical protein